MKVILLNGPPGSGKDTAARLLRSRIEFYSARHEFYITTEILRMSRPLKAAFAAIMGCGLTSSGNIKGYESQEAKAAIDPYLGVSCRQFQIDMSERFMKPLYGNNIFARLFLKSIEEARGYEADENQLYCILAPDCGFTIEAVTLAASLERHELMLIRIHRDGCDFATDSREYVRHPSIHTVDIDNNQSEEEFSSRLWVHVLPFLLQKAP
jgi:hypothetical protein